MIFLFANTINVFNFMLTGVTQLHSSLPSPHLYLCVCVCVCVCVGVGGCGWVNAYGFVCGYVGECVCIYS